VHLFEKGIFSVRSATSLLDSVTDAMSYLCQKLSQGIYFPFFLPEFLLTHPHCVDFGTDYIHLFRIAPSVAFPG
jgi:hypothetical protein